jgi:predicted esterase YcpF (UPF0227 family)
MSPSLAPDLSRARPTGRLIYLHGFRSSPQSAKARALLQKLTAHGFADRFVCPHLPISPRSAWEAILALHPGCEDVVVGSSLGGYYARAVAAQVRNLRVIALNPAVDPARSLAGHLGTQRGWHDDAPLEFVPHYLQELRDLRIEQLCAPERCLLVAARGDELIDWRDMVAAWRGSRMLVLAASDHAITDFERYIDQLLDVAGFGASASMSLNRSE